MLTGHPSATATTPQCVERRASSVQRRACSVERRLHVLVQWRFHRIEMIALVIGHRLVVTGPSSATPPHLAPVAALAEQSRARWVRSPQDVQRTLSEKSALAWPGERRYMYKKLHLELCGPCSDRWLRGYVPCCCAVKYLLSSLTVEHSTYTANINFSCFRVPLRRRPERMGSA